MLCPFLYHQLLVNFGVFKEFDRCIQAEACVEVSPWLLNITRPSHKTLKVIQSLKPILIHPLGRKLITQEIKVNVDFIRNAQFVGLEL